MIFADLLEKQLSKASSERTRNSIAGPAWMPKGILWPTCTCGRRMEMYLQFDIDSAILAEQLNSNHVTIFCCPVHTDPPLFDTVLPISHWTRKFKSSFDGSVVCNYSILIFPKDDGIWLEDQDSKLRKYRLESRRVSETIEPGWWKRKIADPLEFSLTSTLELLKVGGIPCWEDSPRVPYCGCGSIMRFVCQIPAFYEFELTRSESNAENAGLFLGSKTYIMACQNQCSYHAIIPYFDG